MELLLEEVEEPVAEVVLVPVEVAVDSAEAEPELVAAESVVVSELSVLLVAVAADPVAVVVMLPYTDSKEARRLT